jgi:hypothetical protein
MSQAVWAAHTRPVGIAELISALEAVVALGVAAGVLMILP